MLVSKWSQMHCINLMAKGQNKYHDTTNKSQTIWSQSKTTPANNPGVDTKHGKGRYVCHQRHFSRKDAEAKLKHGVRCATTTQLTKVTHLSTKQKQPSFSFSLHLCLFLSLFVSRTKKLTTSFPPKNRQTERKKNNFVC